MFNFRSASILENDLTALILSPKTIASIVHTDWPRACSIEPLEVPDVYVCEAYGGASSAELCTLIDALRDQGKFVIMIWSDDTPFPPASETSLVFDVSEKAPFSCTYGWNVAAYGLHRAVDWKASKDRPILASFIGDPKTDRRRNVLFDDVLRTSPGILIEEVNWWQIPDSPEGNAERIARAAHYLDIMNNSRFVFCPRGLGPSSVRRWEAAYSGAVPILIDDHSLPFGIEIPGLNFATDDCVSLQQNAENLLSFLNNNEHSAEVLQEKLKNCLREKFDEVPISPIHTSVKQVAYIANSLWRPGFGFSKDNFLGR